MPTTADMAIQAAADVLLTLMVFGLYAFAVAHAYVSGDRTERRARRRGRR